MNGQILSQGSEMCLWKYSDDALTIQTWCTNVVTEKLDDALTISELLSSLTAWVLGAVGILKCQVCSFAIPWHMPV